MTRAQLRAHRVSRRRHALALLTAVVAGITLPSCTSVQSLNTPTVTVTAVPTWADPGMPAGDDERWQDPSGLPYCDPSSPLYPCITVNPFSVDGGPEQDWAPVSQELADAFAEGDDSPPANAATRDWEACWSHVTPDTLTIVCPDGYVEVQ